MAWDALIQLGKCDSKKLVYDKIKIEKIKEEGFLNDLSKHIELY